jgi:hypothetical protein
LISGAVMALPGHRARVPEPAPEVPATAAPSKRSDDAVATAGDSDADVDE